MTRHVAPNTPNQLEFLYFFVNFNFLLYKSINTVICVLFLARRASATFSGKTTPVAKLTRDSVLALNGLIISSDEKQRVSFFTSS